MTESKREQIERDLRRHLQQEAMSKRPEFSRQLHQRFCNAIFAHARPANDKAATADRRHVGGRPLSVRHDRSSSTASRGRRLHGHAFTAVVAGGLAIAVAGVFWLSRAHAPLDATAAGDLNPLSVLADVAAQASLEAAAAAENALAANQWDGLAEDAETAANLLLECLPVDMLARHQNGSSAE